MGYAISVKRCDGRYARRDDFLAVFGLLAVLEVASDLLKLDLSSQPGVRPAAGALLLFMLGRWLVASYTPGAIRAWAQPVLLSVAFVATTIILARVLGAS